jgi:protein-L-isoaspartate(D-aspartate) O-methyltransferase
VALLEEGNQPAGDQDRRQRVNLVGDQRVAWRRSRVVEGFASDTESLMRPDVTEVDEQQPRKPVGPANRHTFDREYRMPQTAEMSKNSDQPAKIRDALIERLRAKGLITSPVVERALRIVPRHEFAPAGTSLEVAYNAEDSVTTKTDEHGVVVSPISAPFIQARMIEQGEIGGPDVSVLEIGSGSYNAALLAEVVGPEGGVVSVDIDPEVTDRASTLLDATGYGSRVMVVLADAEHGVPEFGPFDAIIVTVGAWDIPPAWRDQSAHDGVIVVPLRMNGITRSIAFRRERDHLASTSAEVCGFVAMQGAGSTPSGFSCSPTPKAATSSCGSTTGYRRSPACWMGCWRPDARRRGPASRSSTGYRSPTCTVELAHRPRPTQ